jgi:hypothetical protein
MLHIGIMVVYYHPILWTFENFGVYSIILYGYSSKCIYIKIISGIIPKYHTDKLVTENNKRITYSGHGILFASNFVEI